VSVESLLEHRLLFVSGKGGTGKSTVSAALALAARRRGKRVLLAEVDAARSVGPLLGVPPFGPLETEALPGLWTVSLQPPAVMDEYVHHVVKLKWLTRRILQNPVYHRFLAAAPGLKELMVLGKLMTLEQARDGWSRLPRYDTIIVDAPATGHGLAFLKVPQAASQAVPVGPIGTNARRIVELLRDHERTALVVVTLPEEMAVAEAEQLFGLAQEELGLEVACVVLNGCHERVFSAAQEAEVLERLAEGQDLPLSPRVGLQAALGAARRQLRRNRLTRFYAGRLRRTLRAPLVTLPFLFEPGLEADGLRRLSERLEAA
jgi:anion-transporting  ArsA/GET3 family ATPase